MNICACGICGLEAKSGKKFVNGHNNRGKHINLGRKSWNKGKTKEINPELNWNNGPSRKGSKLTSETIAKMRKSHLNKKLAPETIEKIRIAAFGRKHTQEAKNKMRLKALGHKNSLGYHHTANAKKHIGQAHIGKKHALGNKSNLGRKQTSVQIEKAFKNRNLNGHKKFQYTNGIYLIPIRSSWEVLYAKYLDDLGIIWQYEPKGFMLSNGKRYYPDFYLPALNEYHEIKGWMSLQAQEKIDLFKKEYPMFGSKLLMKQDLKLLGVL